LPGESIRRIRLNAGIDGLNPLELIASMELEPLKKRYGDRWVGNTQIVQRQMRRSASFLSLLQHGKHLLQDFAAGEGRLSPTAAVFQYERKR